MLAINSTTSKPQPYTGIDELANTMEEFALSDIEGYTNKMVQISNIAFKCKPLRFKLDAWLRIVYEPSVYNGTGEEERKNIVLELTPEIEQALAAMEDTIRQTLDEKIPNIEAIWVSSFKPSAGFGGPIMKAKINVPGEQMCKFFDEQCSHTATSSFQTLGSKSCPTYSRRISSEASCGFDDDCNAYATRLSCKLQK